jgi:hypothetical protein
MSVIKEFFKGTALTEFELEISAVVQLVMDNPESAINNMVHELTMPLEVIGEGHYGTAFAFTKYPDMVLKVCRSVRDGYPEYIRQVAQLGVKRKRWMPEVLAYGGDEMTQGVFWCVLPKYRNPAEGGLYDAVGSWYQDGGNKLEVMINGIDPAHMFNHYKVYMSKRERRDMRQIKQFLRPMLLHGAEIYMHRGNALKKGEQWIITDPIASWHNKESYAHANS